MYHVVDKSRRLFRPVNGLKLQFFVTGAILLLLLHQLEKDREFLSINVFGLLEEDQVEVFSPCNKVGLHLLLGFFVLICHADLLTDLPIKLT